MTSFRITPKGPFSLEASTRFLEGFAPAAYGGTQHPNHLHLAFPVEGVWENTVGVCIRQASKAVVGDMFGDADQARVRRQVVRLLSLDVDGSGFPEVGKRDRVVGALQRSYAGLRPVLFWSPYEAAAWTIIGHRIRITQAARIKQRMAQDLGDEVVVHGERLHGFPSPKRLASMDAFPGLFARKVDLLHGIAEAALQGVLDAERLRSFSREDALAQLKRLSGIGDFSAELILVRGAGDPDHFSRSERRLHGAMADAYDFQAVPAIERLEGIAEKWRPFRSWVSVLFRAELEDRTPDTSGPSDENRS
ncbi:MAG: DNA-3-methyladenine glycosylase 2 family protein [Actinomycetota bacterium]|nr:DNA-3-methyladenine glycosylase 2 family protein [Actinomycetota bacterium]